MFDGRWNGYLGWVLLLIGFAGAVWLDPWSLSERNPAVLVGSARMHVRHAHAVVVGIGFLQLMVARILTTVALPGWLRRAASVLLGLGALAYVVGYLALVFWPESAWLIAVAAFINFAVFLVLAVVCWGRVAPVEVSVVLTVFCFGMLIDAVSGLSTASPGGWLANHLGPEDGLRLRLLRLARAAAIALSSLSLLARDLVARSGSAYRFYRWGGWLLLAGAVGMPFILTVAAFTTTEAKMLLGLPAQATMWGTLAACWMACKWARPVELWGWLLVALSMAAGLLIGAYAFDGPLPAPAFMGAYNDFPRRLARLAHAYCIVLGLMSILLAREQEKRGKGERLARVGPFVLTVGTVLTLLVLVLFAIVPLPENLLSAGPAVVTAGLLLCLLPRFGKLAT